MKKYTIFLLLILTITFIFSACFQNTKADYNEVVGSKYDYNYGIREYLDIQYNIQHKNILETAYNANGAVNYTCKSEYDDFGNLLQQLVYSANGDIIKKHICVYDENNNLLSKTYYDKNDDITEALTYEYNISNQVIKKGWFFQHSQELSPEIYTYDDKGRLIQSEIEYQGEIVKKYTYKYDENSNCIKETTYDKYPYVISETQIYNTYDSYNNMITKKIVSNGKAIDNYTYSYDKKNRLIAESHYNSFSDSTFSIYYSYDKNGNRLTSSNAKTDSNGIITTIYDENKHLQNIIINDDKGDFVSESTYTYDTENKTTTIITKDKYGVEIKTIYNDNDYTVTNLIYGVEGNLSSNSVEQHDSKGNKLTETKYFKDVHYISYFDKQGREFKTECYTYGELTHYSTTTYDPATGFSTYTKYNLDGSLRE